MVGLVERKLSKSAIWCQRLAVFAIPYFLITIAMHRWNKIATDQAVGLLAFGFVILTISVLFAMWAFAQLWNDGAKGGKKSIFGLLLALTMLAPYFILATLAVRYPAVNDISTNVFSPPEFGEKTLELRRSRGVPQSLQAGSKFDDEDIAEILTAYPKISPRRFPAGTERVYKAVKLIVAKRGWAITQVRGLPNKDEEAQKKQKKKPAKSQDKSKKKKPAENKDNGLEVIHSQDILLDAVYSTLFFSFKNDVVIKIVAEEENTLVEMRSASRWGVHDFGENARIIEKFMHDLDQQLLGISGEG